MHAIRIWGITACLAAVSLAAWRDMGAYPAGCAAVLFAGQALQVALLLAAAALDLRTRLIPDSLVLAMVLAQVLSCCALALRAGPGLSWLLGRSVLGGVALGGGMLAFALAFEALARRPSVGGGDIKLLFAMGFAFGWERGVLMLALACVVFVLAVAAWRARCRLPFRLATAGAGAVAPPPAVAYAGLGQPPASGHPFAPALAVSAYIVVLFF